jgi:hypothetical protein
LMCGTISPPILLKRDSRSVMRMNPSSSMQSDVSVVPAVEQHLRRLLRLSQVTEHAVRPAACARGYTTASRGQLARLPGDVLAPPSSLIS